MLAGRSWDIEEIEWDRRRVFVVPSKLKGKVRWKGAGRGLSFELTRKTHSLILAEDTSTRWSRRAVAEIT